MGTNGDLLCIARSQQRLDKNYAQEEEGIAVIAGFRGMPPNACLGKTDKLN
jgi:hypothetical protein